jgi:hypothetical protein
MVSKVSNLTMIAMLTFLAIALIFTTVDPYFDQAYAATKSKMVGHPNNCTFPPCPWEEKGDSLWN